MTGSKKYFGTGWITFYNPVGDLKCIQYVLFAAN